MVVSVVPANLAKFEKDGTDDNYWVVHGVHRLEAMKELEKRNQLKEIEGFPKDKTILCCILKVSAPSLKNYINIKANDLASEFQSRASNESLLFVYKGLLQSTKNKADSKEVVEKICHSRHVGPHDLAVYRKMFEWPELVLDQLVSVLDRYQNYMTKDATSRGVKSKIRRRELNTLSNTLFRKLGNCSPDFFKNNHARILTNEVSLKEFLDESEQSNQISKSEKKIVFCAGSVDSFDTLRKQFPDKFSTAVLKQYSGAEISGKKRNLQGQRLRNYVRSVQLGVSYKDNVKFETFDHWSEITSAELQRHDVVVLNLCKDNLEVVKCWIDILSASGREFYTVIVVLECEKDIPMKMSMKT